MTDSTESTESTETHERHDGATLRPVERRVLRWVGSGAGDDEIARRFGRSARWVAQVRLLAEYKLATG